MQLQAVQAPWYERWTLFDLPITGGKNLVDFVARQFFSRQLFSDEQLLTHKQREVQVLKTELEDKEGCLPFAEATTSFLRTSIRHTAGDGMNQLPGVAARIVRYLSIWQTPFFVGALPVYAKDQLQRHYSIDETITSSSLAARIGRVYSKIKTAFAHKVLGSGLIWNYSVNINHIVLKALAGISKLERNHKEDQAHRIGPPDPIPKRVASLIESLGKVLKHHDEIDVSGLNDDDAFIKRLEHLKKHHVLPPGLPDPADIRAGELAQKRDEALLAYAKKIAKDCLAKHAPDGLHRGLFGWFWMLEGEYRTAEIAGEMIYEYGLKQITDPHRLYIAVLTAIGVETMEFEHDKFGENSRDRIFTTGKDMMERSLNSGASHYSIVKKYIDSGLKTHPTGSSVAEQKMHAREQLKKIISQMLYEYLDKEQKGPESTFDSIAKQASRLPGLGFTTMFIRGLVNGVVFTVNHVKDGTKTPYFSGLIKHLAGKKATDALADAILDMISHPSWPILALTVVETMIKSFSAEEQDRKIAEDALKENFNAIGSFLLTKAIEPVIGSSVGKYTAAVANNKVFDELKVFFSKPQNVEFLNTAIPLIQPTMKEIALYMKVTDIFRRMGVTFPGDAQFWECFIRERLYRQIDPSVDEETGKLRAQHVYGDTREDFVDRFLALDPKLLRQQLSEHVKEVVPTVVMTEGEPDLQEDYDKGGDAIKLDTNPEQKKKKGWWFF